MKVHAEVMYIEKDGEEKHSDLCPKGCEMKNLDDDDRVMLHGCLDEWLNDSGGSGCFYIKAEKVSIPAGPPDAQYND